MFKGSGAGEAFSLASGKSTKVPARKSRIGPVPNHSGNALAWVAASWRPREKSAGRMREEPE